MRSLIAACLALSGVAGSGDDSAGGRGVVNVTLPSVQFSAADTVLIERENGPSAVVLFTAVTRNEFKYRWKYRGSPGGSVVTGSGRLRERYRHVAWRWAWAWPPWTGLSEEVAPLPDNVTTVRAGEINVEWSARAHGEGYLYYDPADLTIRLLPAEAFEAWP